MSLDYNHDDEPEHACAVAGELQPDCDGYYCRLEREDAANTAALATGETALDPDTQDQADYALARHGLDHIWPPNDPRSDDEIREELNRLGEDPPGGWARGKRRAYLEGQLAYRQPCRVHEISRCTICTHPGLPEGVVR